MQEINQSELRRAWNQTLACRHVRPGAEVRRVHRGWPAGVQAAGAGLHPSSSRAPWRIVGSDRPHDQPTPYGDVRRQGQPVRASGLL